MRTAGRAERDEYVKNGWWGDRALHQIVRDNAHRDPGGRALITADTATTWAGYDARADDIAAVLTGLDLPPGGRVAVQLPDGPGIHAALIGTARAGLVAVGIGQRAGPRETAHLVAKTGATAMIVPSETPGQDLPDGIAHVIGLDAVAGMRSAQYDEVAPRALGPDQLSIINSTSGTTGLPKCVTQFDNRWVAFTEMARRAGRLTSDDIFFGAVPTPFGFGLWTSHYAPAILGVPTVVLPRFDVEAMIALIQRESVTVLCCVSTQFKMLLNSPAAAAADLSSLRVMFTGGEAVPYLSAAEFERRTGATVLQFYGSNETGALSNTTLDDPQDRRLRTAGRVIDAMRVRLFDEDGTDVTGSGGPGIPACRGPLTCGGYFDDDEANAQLYTPDGWMLMGDVAEIDPQGYLTVVGRTSDIIIRGGKNISASRVEEEIDAHPDVGLCAVVAVPDQIFGERVCAVVTLRDGAYLDLDGLVAFLRRRGTSVEMLPEYLLVVDKLPRSSGGKLAKQQIREWAERKIGEGRFAP
ncbi:MAG TPA: class I adenylate-forming enzyme family protein [Mycobacterium sp.]|nr:class I adenylate-forming enzyme family protein [Mycobacterium sp.]